MNVQATVCRAALSALVLSFAGIASAIDITADTEWSAADAQAHAVEAISISEGVALTVNLANASDAATLGGAITGAGALKLAGAGSLTLTGDNGYAGGFYLLGTATVFAQTATALGSGTVHVDARGWVCLKADSDRTFANAVDFTDAGFLCCMPTAKAQFTLTGAITASSHFFVANSYKGDNTYAAKSSKITFKNTVTAPDCYLTFVGNHGYSYTSVHFENAVKAGAVRNSNSGWGGAPDSWASGMGSGRCPTYFYSADNDIGLVVPYWTDYHLSGDAVFGASATLSSADKRHDGYRHGATVDLGAHDQTVASIQVLDTYKYAFGDGVAKLSSSGAMTLTVTGGGSYVTDWLLKDLVSLDWNPPDDGVLTLSNQTHTTLGKITVSKGAVQVAGNTTAANLSEIAVGSNARFRLNTTKANALKSLGRVTAANGGAFEIAAGATPLSGSTLVQLDGTAKIVLGDGVQAKFALVVKNGTAVADGTYVADTDWLELGAGASATLDRSASSENFWVGANGSWFTAASWSKGAVPSTASATAMVLSKQSYTVTVDAAAGGIGALAVANGKTGQTAKLSVASSLQVGDGAKALDIGAGGLVDVPAGGALSMAAGTVGATALRAWVHDGGKMTVKGTVDQTGRKGMFVVQNEGKVAVSGDGMLKVIPGNTAAGMTVANGGSLTATDDAQVHFSAYSWGGKGLVVEKGGVLDVSGNAVVGLGDGGTATAVFGDGTMTFRENSTFGRSPTGAGPGWSWKFAAGSGAPTGTVTFLDHASFIDTASGLYFDRGNGLTARLELYSDSRSHRFNWQTILGGVGARGEVEITDGKLSVGGQGLWLGGISSRGTAVADAVSEGCLRAAGTATVSLGINNSAESDFNGLLVGDCAHATVDPDTGKYYQDTRRGLVEIADNATVTWGYGSPEIMLGVGSTNAFGRLVQSGGTISADTVSGLGHIAVGVGGGQGEWVMTGGEAKLPYNVYVGGATLDDLGKTKTPSNYAGADADHRGKAKGLLKLMGGTFTVGRNSSNLRNLVLSSDGEGTLYLGPYANLSVNGNLVVNNGSKLVVDVRGRRERKIVLAQFGGIEGSFGGGDITLVKDPGSGYRVVVDVENKQILVKRITGLMPFAR